MGILYKQQPQVLVVCYGSWYSFDKVEWLAHRVKTDERKGLRLRLVCQDT